MREINGAEKRSAEQNEDNGVATQEPKIRSRVSMTETHKIKATRCAVSIADSSRGPNVHLAHEAILVHTLAFVTLGLLGPHLLHVLENHVAVSVKGLDPSQELAVVAAGDQDLRVRAGGGLQQRQRAGGELMLLDLSDFIFPMIGDARLVYASCRSLVACMRNVEDCRSEMRALVWF